MQAGSTRGAALPAALLLALWLTGITGWLVAHAVWDRQLARLDVDYRTSAAASDALTEALLPYLAAVPDWTVLQAPGAPVPCPGGEASTPWSAEIATRTARLQATLDARSRWTPGVSPTWRFLTGCAVTSLHGVWRDRDAGSVVLAWVADDPDDPVSRSYDQQMLVHVVAQPPSGLRAGGTATVRRAASGAVWLVAWRPDEP